MWNAFQHLYHLDRGGLVVSVHAFLYDIPSSNPSDIKSFSDFSHHEKTKINAGEWHLYISAF